MPTFYVLPNAKALGAKIANLLVNKIQQQPNLVLGLATGSTMLPVYANFCALARHVNLDLSAVTTFNLDEYIGLAPTHPQSYNFFMQQELFSKLPSQPKQCLLPKGDAENLADECKNYTQALLSQGLDVQLLGIGTNGHIGFNEPGTCFQSRTHVVTLSESTRADNSRFFNDKSQMPTQAVSMGLADIMDAKEVFLLATGAHKAQIMAQLFHEEVSENLPASILKRHAQSKIYLDPAAASLIPQQELVFLS